MADSNGNEYFVKFKENGQHLIILANEFIAGRIAEYFNLPCPSIHVAELHPLLAPAIPPINKVPISIGNHFACGRIANPYTLPASGLISKCKNIHDYPLIILFDVLLYNIDRKNKDNFIIATEQGGLKYYIIDHGHCFGSYWDASILPTYKGQWSDSYIEEMYLLIKGRPDFNDAITKILSLENHIISKFVDEVPQDWLSDANDRLALKAFIQYQRDHIEDMLLQNKSKFRNWI